MIESSQSLKNHVAVLWDTKNMFHRLIEDTCGYCEPVSPLMLSAPFYVGNYTSLIIPTGFGDSQYSKVLPALRAMSTRISKYLNNGGFLLVYGAATQDDTKNVYDWLQIDIEYHFEFAQHKLNIDNKSPWSSLFDGYDINAFTTDGWFTKHVGTPIAVTESGYPVLVEVKIGDGTLLLSTAHEYPSKSFLTQLGTITKRIQF